MCVRKQREGRRGGGKSEVEEGEEKMEMGKRGKATEGERNGGKRKEERESDTLIVEVVWEGGQRGNVFLLDDSDQAS